MHVGEKATVIGWRKSLRRSQVDKLREVEVEVSVISQETCQEWLYSHNRTESVFRDANLCAGSEQGGRESCLRDSGQPLIVTKVGHCTVRLSVRSHQPSVFQEGRGTMIGLLSWGLDCGVTKSPGVVTNIANYVDWVEKITSQEAERTDEATISETCW